MKILIKTLLAIIVAPLALVAADGLVVSVQIDGASQLVVKRDQIYWQHILHVRPGKHGGDYPTLLNDYPWYPQWPNSSATAPGPSAPLAVVTTFSSNTVALIQTAGRGPVAIVQQPSASNDFTLIVTFDDVAADGPDHYGITLSGLSLSILPRLSAEVACIAVSWPTETNRLYRLQYSSLLTTNTWVDLSTPIRGYGTNALFIDSVLGEPRRYYRVITLP